MIRVRVCLIAGFACVAAIMPANASAQDCLEWLGWFCSNSASSVPIREMPRTAVASSSHHVTKHARAAPDGATRRRLTRRRVVTRSVEIGRKSISDLSGHLNDQERESLFQKFSAWQKARRLDTDANSDPSVNQRPAVVNDQEKETLFEEFSTWQKVRRLNIDADR
jgi:hypothetical protein